MTVSIIIPFLNEEENLPDLLQQLELRCREWDFQVELVFVNDGSTDGSVELLKTYSPKGFDLSIVSLSRNFGSHAALRAGIVKAQNELITFLYADLQDPPELVQQMRDAMLSGKDIVWAHRKQQENSQGLLSKIASNAYNQLMTNYVNPNFPKSGFDIVMFNSKVRDQLNRNVEANSSIFLQILNLGYSQDHIHYLKIARAKGKSKWTFSKKMKLFIDSFVAFSYLPIRLVSVVGLLFFTLGILWTAYIAVRTVVWDDLQPGWPSLISILMIGFGITNIGLGVVAEYLWRTLDASRGRPVFVVDEYITKSKAQNT